MKTWNKTETYDELERLLRCYDALDQASAQVGNANAELEKEKEGFRRDVFAICDEIDNLSIREANLLGKIDKELVLPNEKDYLDGVVGTFGSYYSTHRFSNPSVNNLNGVFRPTGKMRVFKWFQDLTLGKIFVAFFIAFFVGGSIVLLFTNDPSAIISIPIIVTLLLVILKFASTPILGIAEKTFYKKQEAENQQRAMNLENALQIEKSRLHAEWIEDRKQARLSYPAEMQRRLKANAQYKHQLKKELSDVVEKREKPITLATGLLNQLPATEGGERDARDGLSDSRKLASDLRAQVDALWELHPDKPRLEAEIAEAYDHYRAIERELTSELIHPHNLNRSYVAYAMQILQVEFPGEVNGNTLIQRVNENLERIEHNQKMQATAQNEAADRLRIQKEEANARLEEEQRHNDRQYELKKRQADEEAEYKRMIAEAEAKSHEAEAARSKAEQEALESEMAMNRAAERASDAEAEYYEERLNRMRQRA